MFFVYVLRHPQKYNNNQYTICRFVRMFRWILSLRHASVSFRKLHTFRQSVNSIIFSFMASYQKILLLVVTVSVIVTVLLTQGLMRKRQHPLLVTIQATDCHESTRKNPENLILPFAPISKDMIVHSVYFDDRARNGHDNVSMFLVGANRTIFDRNWIVGCGVGNKDALDFLAHFTSEDKLMHPFLRSE